MARRSSAVNLWGNTRLEHLYIYIFSTLRSPSSVIRHLVIPLALTIEVIELWSPAKKHLGK